LIVSDHGTEVRRADQESAAPSQIANDVAAGIGVGTLKTWRKASGMGGLARRWPPHSPRVYGRTSMFSRRPRAIVMRAAGSVSNTSYVENVVRGELLLQ
jgi:hypothetical protein